MAADTQLKAESGRIDVAKAKGVILEEIGKAEAEVAFLQFSPFKGKLVSGTVQRADFGGILVNLGKTEAIIPKTEQNPKEFLKRGQNLESVLVDVVMEKGRVKITLSRSAPEMVVEFFKEEVPELTSGEVTMKFCAREAGLKSKFVVDTTESFNPVSVCIGTQGYRIQKVQHRLGGERIDVVQYTRNLQNFTQNLLGVSRLKSFEVNEETKEIKVMVEKDQVARAVGPRGVNVKLASLILDYKIRINDESVVDGAAE